MHLYIPSFYGDVSLEHSPEEEKCFLRTTNLSASETALLKKVLKKYEVDQGKRLTNRKYVLPVPVDKARAFIVKALKGEQKTILAVKIEDPKPGEPQVEKVGTVVEAIKKGAKKAVETVVPMGGCPMPIYDALLAREIRATHVLEQFLTPTQLTDYRRQGSIVVIGGSSRKRYLVSHRHSKTASIRGMVWGLDGQAGSCVHHSHLPAPEEILAIMVALATHENDWLEKRIP